MISSLKNKNKKRIRSSRTQNFFFQKKKKNPKQLKKERVLHEHKRKELKKKMEEKTRSQGPDSQARKFP